MQPQRGLHCGRCSKCRERRDAFAEAGVDDPTTYAASADQIGARRGGWPGADRQEARRRMEPSPVRIFRILPPLPSCARSARRLDSSRSWRGPPAAGRAVGLGADRTDVQLVADAAVAGAGVELGGEILRQVERDAAVAGREAPVVGHRGAGGRAIDDRAVAGVELDGAQSSRTPRRCRRRCPRRASPRHCPRARSRRWCEASARRRRPRRGCCRRWCRGRGAR